MEENEKRGLLICELRKAQQLTQKELAMKMNVTDKAVSKWERGISCPDVGLLIPLSKILDVNVSELLNGEKSEHTEVNEDNTIEDALHYAKQNFISKIATIKKWVFLFLTVASLLALFICLMIEFAMHQTFSWSLIVMTTLFFSWLLLLPLLKAKDDILKKELGMLSLTLFPYLLSLSVLLQIKEVFLLGACIALISLIGLWGIYYVNIRFKDQRFLAAGNSLLILLPILYGINHVIPLFVTDEANFSNDLINLVSVSLLAILCFFLHFYFESRNA